METKNNLLQLAHLIDEKKKYYSSELAAMELENNPVYKAYCQGKLSAYQEFQILFQELSMKAGTVQAIPVPAFEPAFEFTQTSGTSTASSQDKTISETQAKANATKAAKKAGLTQPTPEEPKKMGAVGRTGVTYQRTGKYSKKNKPVQQADTLNGSEQKLNKNGTRSGMTADAELVAKKVAAMNAARLKKMAERQQAPPIIQEHVLPEKNNRHFSNPQFLD